MAELLKQQAIGQHVRELRQVRGMSVRALASETGFSPSFISQLENGQVSPSIASMEKIAEMLGVTLGDFFAAVANARSGVIVLAGQRTAIDSAWSNAQIEALSEMLPGRLLESIQVTLGPGARSGKHPHPYPREAFAFVIEGEVLLTLGPEQHRLAPGDAVTMLPGELRLWENTTGKTAKLLIVSVRETALSSVR